MVGSVLFLVFLALGPNFSFCRDEPIVKTLSGPIMGMLQTSRKGVEFYSFRGIPYAEPPVGELRFKPPVPILSWDDILDATADGPECLQPPYEGDVQNHSEDCLFLNVYTHRINEEENIRPVMVFIHGGAYVNMAGTSVLFGPQYMMDHDIVLVTMNYRLGTLGFLSTGDSVAPGNYGLKDQAAALKWVQNNILFFGGDPNRVTIAGESAGASSVGLQLLSPMSRGLFHGAITASGAAGNSWSVDKHPLETAKKVATVLNCPTDTSENLIECIRQLPGDQVANVYRELMGWHDSPGVILSPVVETDESSERFLTKDPLQSLIDGESANVPLFTGTTKDEFLANALLLEDEEMAADLSANWSRIAPIILGYERDDSISQKLREFYFGSSDEPLTYESFEKLGELFADSTITFGAIRSAKLIAEKNSAPVYLYQFSYQGEYSMAYYPGTNDPVGVAHADDLIYVFYFDGRFPMINTTSEDGNTVDKLTTLYKNFVETGNPTPEPSEILDNVIVTPLNISEPSYLEINQTLTIVNGIYYEDRISLWESLFPLSKNNINN